MGFEIVDRYLLGEPVSKPDAVAALLAERTTTPEAAPFYRAFEAVGTRAADEALLALRLILAGRTADDASVRRLRAFAAVARAGRTGDRAGVAAAFKRDGSVLGTLSEREAATPEGLARLGAAAETHFRELLG